MRGCWTRRRRVALQMLAAAVVAGSVAPGCGSGRPSLEEWEARWDEFVSRVPVETLVTDPPGASECSEILGELRATLPKVQPAPNDVLGAEVSAWVAFAESVFFECPLASGEHIGWEASALELRRLEAEVDAAIAFERVEPG